MSHRKEKPASNSPDLPCGCKNCGEIDNCFAVNGPADECENCKDLTCRMNKPEAEVEVSS